MRDVPEGEKQETTPLELFFDLVFVFAVTQLSHLLLQNLSWAGLGQTMFLLLVVWWAWTYTTWMTNWFDPETNAVRLVLIGAMLASLLMSIGIPDAFGDRSLLFAGGYVALQVGRNTFAMRGFPPDGTQRRTFVHITIWSVCAGVFWISGALLTTPWLTVVWLVALLIDCAGPAARYWVPGRGKVSTRDWAINAGHFSERFQLFVIIALGESIVVAGATASGLHLDTITVVALSVAFVSSAALWWLYFDYVARIATMRLQVADDPGALARDGYTYLHLPIVAGVILAAVGDELVIAHPEHHLTTAQAAVYVVGPALYLIGHVLFRLRMAGSVNYRRLGAAAVILALGVLHGVVSAIVLSVFVASVLVGLILVENSSAARQRARTSGDELLALIAHGPDERATAKEGT